MEVHGPQVIGADVPVSLEGKLSDRKGQKNRSPPAGMGRAFGLISGQPGRGAGRGNCLSRDAAPGFFGTMVSEAGRKSGLPKKGRGTSDGFGRGLVSGLGVERSRVQEFGF
jgi:hypothetical protein